MLDTILTALTFKSLLIGLVTGYFVYRMIQKYRYKLPPGPFPLPLIGNMLQLKTVMLHEQIFEMSKKYGPVMTIYIGPMMLVTVNGIETVTEVLVKKSPEFANRVSTASLNVTSCGGKSIILGQYGPAWKLHRKIAAKAFRHYMQGQALEERVHSAVSVVFEEMKKEEEPYDPEIYVNCIVCNIIIGICFGGRYQFDDPELKRILALDDGILSVYKGGGPPEDYIPGLKYVWESQKMKKLKTLFNELTSSFLEKKYKEHVESFKRENIRDFADTLILARKEAEEDPDETDLDKLTDTHIIMTLTDVFFALELSREFPDVALTHFGVSSHVYHPCGTASSRSTLRYAVLHMVAYPEIQEKVQDEIDRVVGKHELPGLKHRPNLGYTEAVLYESMRLASVVPTGMTHKTTCDTSVAGYDVPKNTLVMINHWALHHDPRAWSDVNEFRPERFLDAEGKLGPKPINWLPFSAGRRVCLGESVAKPELHLIFASLMQKFTWRLPQGVVADLTPLGSSLILYPKPHKLVIEPRGR